MNNLTVCGMTTKLEEWNQRLLECKSSGRTVPEWCRMNGINIKTYYYWHRKIHELVKAQSSDAPAAGFYELPSSEQKAATTERIRITFRDFTVEVPENAEETTLVKVFKAIQQC